MGVVGGLREEGVVDGDDDAVIERWGVLNGVRDEVGMGVNVRVSGGVGGEKKKEAREGGCFCGGCGDGREDVGMKSG